MNENELAVIALAIGVSGIAIVIIVGLILSYKETRLFIEHGYTRQSLPGADGTTWVNP